jgi:hypothetical protein
MNVRVFDRYYDAFRTEPISDRLGQSDRTMPAAGAADG